MSIILRTGRILGLAGVIAGAGFIGPQVQATFIANINQVGPNVVVIGSGTIDLTDLTFDANTAFDIAMQPSLGVLNVGPVPGPTGGSVYTGFSGPATFGSGGLSFADSGSGDLVAIQKFFVPEHLVVPVGYVSGTPLLGTAVYNNATFASLGISPGIYTWTWGSGIHADSFIINAGVSMAVPDTGSSLILLLTGIGAMLAARRRIRRCIT